MSIDDLQETGVTGLSIATDLGILGSVGKHPDYPLPEMPILKVDEVWVNIATLVRNTMNSFPSDMRDSLKPSFLANCCMVDMDILDKVYLGLILEKTIEVKFYFCRRKNIERKYPQARWRTLKTIKQELEFNLLQKTIDILLEQREDEINVFDFEPEGVSKNVALMTHYPIELLTHKQFKNLYLLESHTGSLKDRELWYTKFSTKGLDFMPFDKMTIQMFGDGNNLFAVYPIKLRKKMIEVAKKYRWSYMTTKEKVLMNVELEREPSLYGLIRSMY
jgi:hypothetical protein